MNEQSSERVPGLRFDKTVSLGHVLAIVPLLGALLVAYASYREAHKDHEARIVILESQYHGIANQMKTMWEIKENVAVIKDRIERGLIPPPSR